MFTNILKKNSEILASVVSKFSFLIFYPFRHEEIKNLKNFIKIKIFIDLKKNKRKRFLKKY